MSLRKIKEAVAKSKCTCLKIEHGIIDGPKKSMYVIPMDERKRISERMKAYHKRKKDGRSI